MGWVKEGVAYWENPNCPKEYLIDCLQDLVLFVEGVHVDTEHFVNLGDSELRERVERYEYLSDK